MKRILIACERSGVVRDAFAKMSFDAWSCDIVPTDSKGQHIVCDARNILDDGWDMLIAHPPCTYLSYAGARWFTRYPDRWHAAKLAFDLFMSMVTADIPLIAVENPRGYPCQWYKKPDQIIQPAMFGHNVTKTTCLWLKGLPPLMATCICPEPISNWVETVHGSKNRSKTFSGVATAMAEQWSSVLDGVR